MPIMQGCPEVTDVPLLVSPCSDKMDPEHLTNDIPKYKQFISATSWQEWEKFLANLKDIESLPTLSWSLPQLLSASIVASAQRKRSGASPVISPDTLSLLDKEIAPPPPVSTLDYSITDAKLKHMQFLTCR